MNGNNMVKSRVNLQNISFCQYREHPNNLNLSQSFLRGYKSKILYEKVDKESDVDLTLVWILSDLIYKELNV